MHEHYDLAEILELAKQGSPAALIKEELGLGISVRRVQQIVHDHLGRRPTRRAIQQRDVLRSRVVHYVEGQGLSRYYCYQCQRRQLEPCFIRELNSDLSLDVLVFVCRHCATVADV